MAQFDVYVNPSESASKGIPYVVVMQSDLLESLATRMTIPLASIQFASKAPEKLCPTVLINGQRLRALAHYAAPLPSKNLKKVVSNLSRSSDALIGAMDAVFAGV